LTGLKLKLSIPLAKLGSKKGMEKSFSAIQKAVVPKVAPRNQRKSRRGRVIGIFYRDSLGF
jgi:hypothetical protein